MGRNRKGGTLIIGGVIVVLVIALVVMLMNNSNKNKFQDNYEEVEQNIIDNLQYLTSGYNTEYFGTEKLFEKSLKFKNLKDENLLATAISVYNMETEDTSDESINIDSEKLSNYDTYILVKGSIVKDYIKKIFNIDWAHKSIKGTDDFIYNFEYDSDNDAYIVYPSDAYKDYEEKLENFNSSIVIEPISSISTSKAVKTTIAVAYSTYIENEDSTVTIKYYKDKDKKDLVFEINSNDMYTVDEDNNIIENNDADNVKKHSKDFQNFVVTSTKTDNGFAFTSIKKK